MTTDALENPAHIWISAPESSDATWYPEPHIEPATEYVRIDKHDEISRVAEAARAFIWEPENWEAYQDSKSSNSAAWPPEFLMLAQLVEVTYGQMPVEDNA